MKRLNITLVALLLISTLTSTFSQSASQKIDSTLSPVSQLAGQWSGSGWLRTRSGQRVEFNQTESIEFKLDGQIMTVNGIGKDKNTGKKSFEAFGILSYNKQKSKYVFDAYTAEGQHTLADVALSKNKFDWWFDVPNGGTIKYSITFDDHSWSEDGNYSPDGNQWYPFFHMDLTKE